MSEIARLLAGYPVVIEQAVAWAEMDAYHHVNNAVYFRYFENVRIEYFRRMGWPELEKDTDVGPIVASLRAKFRKPLTFPDTISVTARLHTMGEDRFSLEHVIVSHRLAAVTTEGEGTVVTYNYREKKKVPVPELWKARIGDLEAMARRDG